MMQGSADEQELQARSGPWLPLVIVAVVGFGAYFISYSATEDTRTATLVLSVTAVLMLILVTGCRCVTQLPCLKKCLLACEIDSEVAAQRLLILGAKWQKGAQAELYRDAEAVEYAVRVLTELLPGADAPSIFHKKPSVALLCMDRHELSRRLVALREGARLVPPLDVAATLNKDPSVVSLEDAERIETGVFATVDAVIAATGFVLDPQGVASVIETCPAILTAHPADVADAFSEYKRDLRTRLDGVKGWSSALLLAFSEEGTSDETRTSVTRNNETEKESKKKSSAPWRSCWNSLGEDARATATRASADFAGRDVANFLRRAEIRRRTRAPNDANEAR